MLDAGNHMTSTYVFFNERENECYCNECGCFFPDRYAIDVRNVIDKQDRRPVSFVVCSEECAEELKKSLESEGEEKFKIII